MEMTGNKFLCLTLIFTVSFYATVHAECSNDLDSNNTRFRFHKCNVHMVRYEYKIVCEESETIVACQKTSLKEMHEAVLKENGKQIKLIVTNSDLKSDDAERIWTNVTHLQLENITFTQLEENLLKGFEHLTILEITKTEISQIHANSFKTMKNLEKINISGNVIKALDKDSFNGLENVISLSLRQNEITELPKEIFSSLKKVQEIDLSHNKLTKIETEFPVLKELLLNDNQIKGDFNFSLLNRMTEGFGTPVLRIQLSNNQIENLVDLNISQVTTLVLTNNKIKSLPQTGDLLDNLDISHNNLTTLRPFAKFELVTMDASYNQIDNIEANAFTGAKFLRHLNLSHNNLGNLTHGCFNYLDRLTTLDLSYNHISNLGYGVMDPMIELTTLDISYNNNEIDLHTLLNLYKLTHLKLVGNKVDKFDPEIFVDHFTKLEEILLDDTVWSCQELSRAVALIETKSKNKARIGDGTYKNESNVRGIKCADSPGLKLMDVHLDQDQLHPQTVAELTSSLLLVEQNNHKKLAEILAQIHIMEKEEKAIVGPLKDVLEESSSRLKNIHTSVNNQLQIVQASASSSSTSSFMVVIVLILFAILAVMVYNVFYLRRSKCSGEQINLV